MDHFTRKFAHGLIFVLGLVLMVAGIATQTKGAPIIGLIVAAVNYQLYHQQNAGQSAPEIDRPNE